MSINSRRLCIGLCGLLVVPVFAGGGSSQAPADDRPVMSVRSAVDQVAAGEQFVVEAYVEQVDDLGVFQVQLSADAKGNRGRLTIVDVQVDKQRADFALSGGQVIAAADQKNKRAGALLMSGGASVKEARYLATFTLQASKDALGTFEININPGTESFLNDSTSVAMNYSVGAPVKVAVAPAEAKSLRKSSR